MFNFRAEVEICKYTGVRLTACIMKKFFLCLALGACAFLLSSCNRFKTQTVRLSDKYTATTELSEKGDTLWAIKTYEDGQQVTIFKMNAEPRCHSSYAAFITEKDPDGWRNYYSLKGKELGRLKKFQEVSGDLYEAVSPEGKILYFKESEEVINIKGYRLFNGYLGYQRSDDVFTIVALSDASSWTVPEESFIWVETPTTEEGLSKPKIVVVDKKQVYVYNVAGEEEQKMPLAKWNKLIKGIKMTPFGKAQRCELPKL